MVEGTRVCWLCRKAVDNDFEAVITAPFLTKRDPLWRYAGGSLHRKCFLAWDRRKEFIRKFNLVMAPLYEMDGEGEVTSLSLGAADD